MILLGFSFHRKNKKTYPEPHLFSSKEGQQGSYWPPWRLGEGMGGEGEHLDLLLVFFRFCGISEAGSTGSLGGYKAGPLPPGLIPYFVRLLFSWPFH